MNNENSRYSTKIIRETDIPSTDHRPSFPSADCKLSLPSTDRRPSSPSTDR
uniref:Uncharacterized protein n=1 Tax=Arion vulgaris TaxID=1028688 RepID=A0A0B6Z6V0_9EUPU